MSARQRQVQSSGQNFSHFTHPSRRKIFLSSEKFLLFFFFCLFLSLSMMMMAVGDGGGPFSLINFPDIPDDFDHVLCVCV